MRLLRSRKGMHLTITGVILLILAILFLMLFGLPFLAKLRQGAADLYRCPGECRDACPSEGWREEGYANGDCKKDGLTQVCCVQTLYGGAGPVARGGDIEILYNGETLPNGATATLVPRGKSKGGEYWAEGKFSVKVTGDAAKKKCYWKVGDGNWEEYLHRQVPSSSALFPTLIKDYWTFIDSDAQGSDDFSMSSLTTTCDAFKTTSLVKFGLDDQTKSLYPLMLGERIKMDLVVVDDKCEESDFTFCDNYVQSLFIQIPDQKALIDLYLGGTHSENKVSKTSVTTLKTDDTYDFTLKIDGPLPKCSFNYSIPLTDSEGEPLLGSNDPEMLDSLALLQKEWAASATKSCFGLEREERFKLTLNDDDVKGIPFTLNVKTWMEGDHPRTSIATYRFLIEPEKRVKVLGPSPGLDREKAITLSCDGVACSGQFEAAYIDNPLLCSKKDSGKITTFLPVENLTVYGGQASGQWRYLLKTEKQNGKYICIKAKTNSGDIYSLGLWNNVPTRVTIDRTPPKLKLAWHSSKSYLEMNCDDSGNNPDFVSGCGAKPFSYAYITNPFLFVANLLSGGSLAADWAGCPDPETGNWAMINRDDNQWPYISNDIRVICVKAEDNAGNWDTDSRLLFSSQEALALLMRQYAKETS